MIWDISWHQSIGRDTLLHNHVTILGGTASELASRRAEYDSVIQKIGIVALIEALKDKTAGFAND